MTARLDTFIDANGKEFSSPVSPRRILQEPSSVAVSISRLDPKVMTKKGASPNAVKILVEEQTLKTRAHYDHHFATGSTQKQLDEANLTFLSTKTNARDSEKTFAITTTSIMIGSDEQMQPYLKPQYHKNQDQRYMISGAGALVHGLNPQRDRLLERSKKEA